MESAAALHDLLKPKDDRLGEDSASLLDGGSRIRLHDTRDLHCVTPFAGRYSAQEWLAKDRCARGALDLDWKRQHARRYERFLSPRAYRLLEFSPAINESGLQKTQNAAILQGGSFAGELKP